MRAWERGRKKRKGSEGDEFENLLLKYCGTDK